MSLYTEILKRGIPHASHESDLYIPVTAETRELLKASGLDAGIFRNQVEGGFWFDVPFMFDPWWDARTGNGAAVQS